MSFHGGIIKKTNIEEKSNEYIYTTYYYNLIGGDFGLYDEILYYKQNIVINKYTGKYIIEPEQKIREFYGKYNPSPVKLDINLEN